jgi:hypothetical protein
MGKKGIGYWGIGEEREWVKREREIGEEGKGD